ncbi:MAG: RHS repeat-associated core domain-containing protein, partial [Bacteroidota bacterium]
YTQRQADDLGTQEQAAATKTVAHANTPTTAYFDTLGRPFLTLAYNGQRADGTPELYPTRAKLDIEGNQRAVRDAIVQADDPQGRIVMRYDYDLLGNRVHQASMEAGSRWMISNVAGNPLLAWDSRGHIFRTEYDPLRRPLRHFVTGANPSTPDQEFLTERLVYGEQHPEAVQQNLRGQIYLHFDQAGVAATEAYDFKSNLLKSSRRLEQEYKQAVDWGAVDKVLPMNATTALDPEPLEAALAPRLEADTFTSHTTYDALNRPVAMESPDSSIIRPRYNEANLLEQIEVTLQGADTATTFVENIDYDAKGQRTQIQYGNGVNTAYTYDILTFRLMRMHTLRQKEALQDLTYTYDPAGNITYIRDSAQQTLYFRNQRVEPSNDYTYDAIYRLIKATGREHLGQAGGKRNAPISPDAFNSFHTRLDHPGDGNAMGRYMEQYIYDAVGNILSMQHRGSDSAHAGWTRNYAYGEASLTEPNKHSNRLSNTTLAGATPQIEPYQHDVHGNIIRMPHLANHADASAGNMHWDYKNQLRQVDLGGGGTAYYTYDAAGQRVRKVWEKSPKRTEERFYIGTFEVFRRRNGEGVTVLERETLHVMGGQQRIALVETCTIDREDPTSVLKQLIRYQFSNHLGSSNIELDEQAKVISYEEYTPFGSTSYQAVRSQTEVSKRYRYTSKEHDEETGLHYYGARYYATSLGRWISSDPAGLIDGENLFVYVSNDPIGKIDTQGQFEVDWKAVGRGALYAAAGVAVAVVVVGAVAATGGAAAAGIATYAGATATTAAAAEAAVAGTVYVGAAAYGGYQTGQAVTEVATGEDYETGRTLTDTERSERIGEATVMVGALAFGGRRALRARAEAKARTRADQEMLDSLIQRRASIPTESRNAAKRRGRMTSSRGRTSEGELTEPRESIPRGGSHAEPQTVEDLRGSGPGQTVVVDQVPCTACDPMLEAELPAGSRVLVPREVGSPRPVRSIDPRYATRGGVKGAAEAAARGEIQVEPYEIIRTPQGVRGNLEFTPARLDLSEPDSSEELVSIDPTLPTRAEIEAQQSLPESERYR